MDFQFLYFVLFSFVLIALVLFIIFFLEGLKEMKGRFRGRQYMVYVLGSFFILGSLFVSYFLYLYASPWLGLFVFVVFNGIAGYFFYLASLIVRKKE